MKSTYNLNWETLFSSLFIQAILLFIHNYFYDSYSYIFLLYEFIFFLIYSWVIDGEFEFIKIESIQKIFIKYLDIVNVIFGVFILSSIFYIYSTGDNFISSTLISLIFVFALTPLSPSDEENDTTIYWRDRLEKYEKGKDDVKY